METFWLLHHEENFEDSDVLQSMFSLESGTSNDLGTKKVFKAKGKYTNVQLVAR